MTHRPSILALTGAALVLLATLPVAAQTTTIACGDTTQLPNPIYMGGSSAFEPILSQLAVQIRAKQNVSIIYAPISSCTGVSAISPPADLPTVQTLTGTAHYYTADPTDPTKTLYNSCNLSGNLATIGVSDVAFDSCQGAAKPAGVGEWFGPQQAMLIVVPKANLTTTALSAEQAAVIWGCGKQGNFATFIDENGIQKRSSTSGTQILVARNIRVPESVFRGKANDSSSAMFTSLIAVADPQTAIGFLAADFYATHRSVLNAVAFRGVGQNKAYYPDSDSISDDMLNVREGRYMIQGPLHLFSNLDKTTGAPSPIAAKVLDWLTGTVPIDASDVSSYVRIVATSGAVPQCAMKVKIDKDGGLFSPSTLKATCNCAYQRAKGLRVAPGACSLCKNDTDCTSGLRCQFGNCE